jgi:2,4-dienoyl-CoA reductase-like NADH-dependent reductase (Old Yellow Enzyme family)
MDALFSPTTVAGVEVRNRVVFPPMTTRLGDAEGSVTDALVAYYEARARGGAGLITVEMGSPEKVGRHRFGELGVYDDKFLPGLERLVGVLHDAGARVSVQLGHGGSRAPKAVSGQTPIAPSPVLTSVYEREASTVMPLEMTKARIEQTTQAFVEAARRMQKAGFDFVELHGAHGYLISQFLTPFENRRTDEYGGTLENRARFGLDILRRIKHEAQGLPVIFRLGVEDFFPGGFTFAEALQVAQWAARAGADALSITAGHYRSLPSAARMIPPMAYPEGTFVDFGARVKEKVGIPVIGVGRLGNIAVANAAVEGGKVDMIVLGRTLIADPDWVNNVRSGAAVRRCISCNHCVNNMRSGAKISCLVNPITGFELDFADPKPPNGENICVVGAGPAGLSYASLVADQNRVTVIERAPVSGGAFRYTGKAPQFEEVEAVEEVFRTHITELERACREKGVGFRHGVDVTKEPRVLAPYDRLVFATGAPYRYGLGRFVPALLNSGLGRSALAKKLFAVPRMRKLLYYRLRKGSGHDMRRLAQPHQKVTVIGDAKRAGKTREALDDAFRAALLADGDSKGQRGQGTGLKKGGRVVDRQARTEKPQQPSQEATL